MSPAVQQVVAVVAGLAALVVLVCADILGWAIGVAAAGLLGSLAGGTVGYLVRSPGQQDALIRALRETSRALAEPKAADSTEALPR